MAAIHHIVHLFGTCLDHPQRVIGGLYRSAKFLAIDAVLSII